MSRIGDDSSWAAIGGGHNGIIGTNSICATVGGGRWCWILDNAEYAVIGGGFGNVVGDNAAYASAAGRRAHAMHAGAHVWADSNDFDFPSESNNQFNARATGGFRFVTAIDGAGNATAGVRLHSGSGSWNTLSDRDMKTGFEPVNSRAVLEKVAALPVATWRYKAQDASIRHIGPIAQDFHAAFGVGEDPKGIATVDADGVAFSAIQGLYEMVQELRTENAELRQELDALKAQLK